ncbi:hypothetical protein MMC18_003067 [Xylographa bjoerkii]|nr:hypothetical protein [Xylographa bjoerkii]
MKALGKKARMKAARKSRVVGREMVDGIRVVVSGQRVFEDRRHGDAGVCGVTADEVSSLVGSIENLQALLQHIEDILRHDTLRSLQSTQFIVQWDKRVKECEKDLGTWLQAIQVFQSGDAKCFKKCVRNLKAAADEGRFQKMRLRLGAHYEHLSLHLDILNGNIGLKNAQMLVATGLAADRINTSQAELRSSTACGLTGIAESTKRIETLGESGIDQIRSGLKDFGALGSTNHIETIAYLERIEQRCRDVQLSLLRSIKKSKKSARCSPVPKMPLNSRTLGGRAYISDLSMRHTDTANDKTERNYTVQVVRPGILMYESSGSVSRVLLSLEDPVYTSRTLKEKIALVQQLQNIRLVIWLLRRDRVCYFINAFYQYPSISSLGLEGNLMFNWYRNRVGPLRILRMLKENQAFIITCYWLSSPKAGQVLAEYYDISSYFMLQMARAHFFFDNHYRNCYCGWACKERWEAFIGHQTNGDQPEVSKDIVEVFRKLLSNEHRLEDLVIKAVAERMSVGKR